MDIASSFTLEWHVKRNGDVLLVASIPGREGTLTHSWPAGGGGRLSPARWADALAAASRLSSDWIMLAAGLQTELPV